MSGKLWKNELARVLCEIGLVDANYTGKLVINLNQGGVTEVEKIEKVAPESIQDQGLGEEKPADTRRFEGIGRDEGGADGR